MRVHRFFIAVWVSLFAIHLLAFGGTAGIKERMKKRLPVINALKAKGVVGENNKGFLEFRGKSQEGKETIDGENKDRSIVYSAIAKKTKTTPEIVGGRRAKKIAQTAPSGHWLQDEKGKWYQK